MVQNHSCLFHVFIKKNKPALAMPFFKANFKYYKFVSLFIRNVLETPTISLKVDKIFQTNNIVVLAMINNSQAHVPLI